MFTWGNYNMTAVNSTNVNTLRPRQNGRHFADDTFKRMFLNEDVRISIRNSPKFVPKGPTNNIPALVQIMAWHRPGDKPLSEPMMIRLSTHICVTRPQWVKNPGVITHERLTDKSINSTTVTLFGDILELVATNFSIRNIRFVTYDEYWRDRLCTTSYLLSSLQLGIQSCSIDE